MATVHGTDGEASGHILISGSLKVWSYGGGGGTGGGTIGGNLTDNSGGGGAGGYPAAGIGGGGAGGGGSTGGGGAGGFSSGAAESSNAAGGNNGQASIGVTVNSSWWQTSGGGYFSNSPSLLAEIQSTSSPISDGQPDFGQIGGVGGIASIKNKSSATSHFFRAAHGGSGGECGETTIYTHLDNVHAYNGAYMTESDGQSYIVDGVQTKASPIYAQLGFSLDDIRAKGIADTSDYREDTDGMVSYLSSQGVARNIEPAQILGIGSGAGYTETSNGTLKIGIDHDLTNASLNIRNSETYYNKRKVFSGGGTESLWYVAVSLFGATLCPCICLPSVCLEVGAG